MAIFRANNNGELKMKVFKRLNIGLIIVSGFSNVLNASELSLSQSKNLFKGKIDQIVEELNIIKKSIDNPAHEITIEEISRAHLFVEILEEEIKFERYNLKGIFGDQTLLDSINRTEIVGESRNINEVRHLRESNFLQEN